MTMSEGDRANENDRENEQVPKSPDPPAHTSGNERPQEGPPSPQSPTEEYQDCLEEVAAIVASDAEPTVALAQLAMVLSAAEDRGLISPGPSGY